MMTTVAGVVHAIMVLKMPGAVEAIAGELFFRYDTIMCHTIRLHKFYRHGRYDNRGSVGFSDLTCRGCFP
jgi:hypothetical protein